MSKESSGSAASSESGSLSSSLSVGSPDDASPESPPESMLPSSAPASHSDTRERRAKDLASDKRLISLSPSNGTMGITSRVLSGRHCRYGLQSEGTPQYGYV
jgi:hypothetical protein